LFKSSGLFLSLSLSLSLSSASSPTDALFACKTQVYFQAVHISRFALGAAEFGRQPKNLTTTVVHDSVLWLVPTAGLTKVFAPREKGERMCLNQPSPAGYGRSPWLLHQFYAAPGPSSDSIYG